MLKSVGDVAFQRSLLEVCRQDILFWVNTFVWQFNPNSIGDGSDDLGPFNTWGFQEEALRVMLECVERRKDLCIEKSREMGASWLCLLLFDWLFLFHDWKKFLVISRNEQAVDRPGDPDCLFWKLDFIHSYLPDWMSKRVRRRKLGFENRVTHSTINGQASTGKAGVGGRATAMFIDEFSQIDEDFEVLHRTSDTTGCRIFNFTHLGLHTAAYHIAQRVDMKKLKLHWSQHPDKARGLYRCVDHKVEVFDKQYQFEEDFDFVMDGSPQGGYAPGLRSPWYDEQSRRKGDTRQVAMDLDINPEGTVEQFFSPLSVQDLKAAYCMVPLWEGELDYDTDTGEPVGLIAVPNGRLKLWIKPDVHGRIPKARYGVGCDVSTGSGATNSCLSILNLETGEKIGQLQNPNMEPKEFGTLGVAICRWCVTAAGEPAVFIWEIPGPGQTLAKQVEVLGFRNVYRAVRELAFTKKKRTNTMAGWTNTPAQQNELLRAYRSAVERRQFLNRSASALDECLKFSYDSNGNIKHAGRDMTQDPSGAKVNHGDQVIADALACKLLVNPRMVQQQEVEEYPVNSLGFRRMMATADRGEPWDR